LGLSISASAARTLMTPKPEPSVRIMSLSRAPGSPKKRSPPCCSRVSSARWMVPIDWLADIAVLGRQAARILRRPLQHGLQVLEVEQQQALLVGDLEDDVEDALLRLVELQQARHQDRPDLAHRRAHRMALGAEQVPVERREGAARIAADLELLRALDRLGFVPPAWLTPERSPLTSAMKTGTP
jgi:hypothetical protein